MAAPRPGGVATPTPTAVTTRLPASSVEMLKAFWRGFHESLPNTVDHSTSEKNSQPLLNSEYRMRTLISSDAAAAVKNRPPITCSLRWRRGSPDRSSGASGVGGGMVATSHVSRVESGRDPGPGPALTGRPPEG